LFQSAGAREVALAAAIALISAAQPAHAQRQVTEYYGTCEASAAVAVDRDHFLVADDQDSVIRLYARHHFKPIREQDFSAELGVPPEATGKGRKTDIEAAAAIGRRVYWLTSHGGTFPLGRRFFATDMVGQGGQTKLEFAGVYTHLRDDLSNDSALAAYGFKNDNADNPDAEGGFNMEGLAATPDKKLLIGFRNPIPGGKALIVQLDNPDEVLRKPDAQQEPARARFGKSYLLDLDGLGIRSLERVGNRYLVMAGSYLDCPCLSLRLWSGVVGEKPRVLPLPLLADTRIDFRPEAMFVIPGTNRVQMLSDDGDVPRLKQACKHGPVSQRRLRSFTFRL
jgi:hypothetical protein